MKKRKGQVWVSAVLFIALGVLAISLILSAAIPLINKLTDKNTVVQTKEVLQQIDDTVRTVAHEGPGSQRQISPLVLEKGKLFIPNGTYQLYWELDTEAILMEPNIEIMEGNIRQVLNSTFIEDSYTMKLWMNNDKVNLTLNSPFSSPFKGRYGVVIKHTGYFDPSTDNPIIEMRIV